MRENAAELPDGTKVFRSNNGSIYTQHGKRISDDKARDITFPKGAPNWETYKAEKEGYDTAARQKEEVDVYQKTVLDPTTKQIKDKKNPRSMDELKELDDRDMVREMPDVVKAYVQNKELSSHAENSSSISNAHKQVKKTNLNAPNVGKSFDHARTDIPDLGNALDTNLIPVNTQGK